MMFGLKITADFCSQLDNLNCCKKDSTVHVHVLTKGCFCFVQNGSANMDMAFQCIETDCNLLVYSSRVKLTQLMCPSRVKRGRMVTSRRVVCRRTAAMNLLRGRNAVHFRNKTFSNDWDVHIVSHNRHSSPTVRVWRGRRTPSANFTASSVAYFWTATCRFSWHAVCIYCRQRLRKCCVNSVNYRAPRERKPPPRPKSHGG